MAVMHRLLRTLCMVGRTIARVQGPEPQSLTKEYSAVDVGTSDLRP